MFQNKMALRKKAMDAMMKEAPSMQYKKKAMPQEMQMQEPEQENESGMENEQEGYEQFMVTPEEKQMILEMRMKKGGKQMPGSQQGNPIHNEME